MNPDNTPQQYTSNYSVLIERIDSEIGHINALVDARLESLKTLMSQRADFLTADSKKDIENLAGKIHESVQEMRNYKDILQQQLVLLDSAAKSAHQRLDTLQIEVDEILSGTEAYRRQASLNEQALKDIQDQIDGIQTQHANEALLTKVKKENPIRIFFTEQILKKYAALIVGSLASYLFLNLKNIVEFLTKVFTKE